MRKVRTRNTGFQVRQVSRSRLNWGKHWVDMARDAVYKAKYGEEPPPHGFYGGTSLPSSESAPDLFNAGKEMMGDTPPFTAEEYMKRLQVIEEKLQNDTKLCKDERMMWEGVRQQLQASMNSDYCTAFHEYHGTCCFIQAEGENFGFCTYDTLIEIESSGDVIDNCIMPEKVESTPECEPEASLEPDDSNKCMKELKVKSGKAATSSRGNEIRTSSRAELFVNLMSSVSCTATDLTSLCSAFCCTEKYEECEFCDVPCY